MSGYMPDAIRQTVQALTRELQQVLGPRLVGIYLGGSVVMDDYRVGSSNIDFLVITQCRLSPEDGLAIAQVHRDLRERFPEAHLLEGDYVPLPQLTANGTVEPVPGCEHGTFYARVGEIILQSVTIESMRTFGIALYGPPPALILPEPTRDQVQAAARQLLEEGFEHGPMTAHSRARRALAAVRGQYTALTGQVTPKSEAAVWGLTHLSSPWPEVIQSALRVLDHCNTAADEFMLAQTFPQLLLV